MDIEISDLIKQYNKSTIALKGINLSIGKGSFGLLGRNGSGKTTLLRTITTLLEPTEGVVTILGLESNKQNSIQIRNKIGYLPQEFGFYKEFTIMEILEYISIMRKIESKKQKLFIEDVLDKVTLYQKKDMKYKQLSGGMKRRVGLAQAMLGNPPILIVDEPTAGVDPEERIKIRKLLSEYGQQNTVLFSTHIVEDIEYTCNQLAVLDNGNLLFNGSLNELLKMASNNVLQRVFNTFKEFKEFEERHKVISFKREDNITKAVFIGDKNQIPDSQIYPVSLEEAYVYITTKDGDRV